MNEAVRLDPDFALALALAAACYFDRRVQGAMADVPKEVAEATRLARRAAELGKNDATALCYAGLALAYVAGDVDAGASLIDRALLLNPNYAAALHCRSWIKGWNGEPDQAIDDALQAIRLSPFDPRLARVLASLAYAHFFAGRYSEASTWAEKSLQNDANPVALRVLAASRALAGRLKEAQGAILRLRHLDPALRVSHIKKLIPIRRSDDLARLEDGLRLAGLPEYRFPAFGVRTRDRTNINWHPGRAVCEFSQVFRRQTNVRFGVIRQVEPTAVLPSIIADMQHPCAMSAKCNSRHAACPIRSPRRPRREA